MKKIALCSFALLGLAVGAYANGIGKIHVTKSNGGANGYDYVSQNTGPTGQTFLNCENMGYMKCEAVEPPPADPFKPKAADINSAISVVDSRISSGRLSGSAIVAGYEVKWEGTNLYNYILDMTALQSD